VSGSGISWVICNAYSLRPPARSPPAGDTWVHLIPHSTHPQSSSLHCAVKVGSHSEIEKRALPPPCFPSFNFQSTRSQGDNKKFTFITYFYVKMLLCYIMITRVHYVKLMLALQPWFHFSLLLFVIHTFFKNNEPLLLKSYVSSSILHLSCRKIFKLITRFCQQHLMKYSLKLVKLL